MKKLWLLLFAVACFAQNTPIYPTRASTVADLTVATNNATTSLALSMGALDTSITVTSTIGFTAPVLLFIDLEEIKCSGLTPTTFTGCTRGFDNTIAASHSVNSIIGNFVAAYAVNQLNAEVMSIEGDLIGGLPAARGGTSQTTSPNNTVLVGNGTRWLLVSIGDCQDASGKHLNFTASTNSISCGTSSSASGGGSVTSVAISIPNSVFTISGSPITGAGTITATPTGTSGGLVYFSGASSMASSAVLAANQPIVGGGAGVSPQTIGSSGTTTTVLHGNASGLPSYGGVTLADIGASNLTGNGAKLATSTGTLTSNNCVKIDANGNLIDAGVTCGAGTPAFSAITSGTNATATMLVNAGASISPVANSTGIVGANALIGYSTTGQVTGSVGLGLSMPVGIRSALACPGPANFSTLDSTVPWFCQTMSLNSFPYGITAPGWPASVLAVFGDVPAGTNLSGGGFSGIRVGIRSNTATNNTVSTGSSTGAIRLESFCGIDNCGTWGNTYLISDTDRNASQASAVSHSALFLMNEHDLQVTNNATGSAIGYVPNIASFITSIANSTFPKVHFAASRDIAADLANCFPNASYHAACQTPSYAFYSGPQAAVSAVYAGPAATGNSQNSQNIDLTSTAASGGSILWRNFVTATGVATQQLPAGGNYGWYIAGSPVLSLSATTLAALAFTANTLNGNSLPTSTAADQVLTTSAAATGFWTTVPLCLDTTGQHLNYDTSTHLFICGTSSPSTNTPTYATSTVNAIPRWSSSGVLDSTTIISDPTTGAIGFGDAAFFQPKTVAFNAGAPNFDLSTANYFDLTVTANATLTISNGAAINSAFPWFTWHICQDATGGWTVTLPSGFSGATPIGTDANECTTQSFWWNGSNAINQTSGITSLGATYIKGPVRAAPSTTPASGNMAGWFDLTGLNFQTKNSAGNKTGTAFTLANASHKWLNSFDATTGLFTQTQPAEADLSFTDITTNNVSTSAHGFAPKGDNVATHFLNGQGAYTTPSGSVANPVSLIDYQNQLTPVTASGVSADQTLFTTTIASIPAGGCVSVEFGLSHTTGTVSTTYRLFYSTFSVTWFTSTNTALKSGKALLCNNPGVQNAQQWNFMGGVSNNGGSFAGIIPVLVTGGAITSSSSQTLKLTFNAGVNNTDTYTPNWWYVTQTN